MRLVEMDHLKYLLSLFFPLSVVWFLYAGPHNVLAALAWTLPLWLLIVLDWFSPKTLPNKQKNIVSSWFYDGILYILSFVQFLIISLLLINASQLQWDSISHIGSSLINLVVMRILVGTSSGSSAIIVAHELIHRRKLHQRIVGQLLLYTVCYPHFVIAHMQGHHLNVATPEDITTARIDESFDSYWKRVLIGHFKYAWNFEQQRLGLNQTDFYYRKTLENKVLQGIVIDIFLLVLIWVFFGWVAVFIFLYQALSGIRLLETINYYQHWGLEDGKANNAIAWVNSSQVTEYALLGLSHHLEHHKSPQTHYYQTPDSVYGPMMPYGYFVTNLWVKLNNNAYRKVSTEKLQQYFQSLNTKQ